MKICMNSNVIKIYITWNALLCYGEVMWFFTLRPSDLNTTWLTFLWATFVLVFIICRSRCGYLFDCSTYNLTLIKTCNLIFISVGSKPNKFADFLNIAKKFCYSDSIWEKEKHIYMLYLVYRVLVYSNIAKFTEMAHILRILDFIYVFNFLSIFFSTLTLCIGIIKRF